MTVPILVTTAKHYEITKISQGIAYLRTSSAANVGEDKDSGRRQLTPKRSLRELGSSWQAPITTKQ